MEKPISEKSTSVTQLTLSLAQACLQTIKEKQNNAILQDDLISFICSPRVIDSAKKELIEKLSHTTLLMYDETYQSIYGDFIADQINQQTISFSEENLELLIEKLPATSIDILTAYTGESKSEVITALKIRNLSDNFLEKKADDLITMFIDSNTSHKVRCAILEKIKELHKINIIMQLATKGEITEKIATIAASIVSDFNIEKTYQSITLRPENKKLLKKAHGKAVQQLLESIIIEDRIVYRVATYEKLDASSDNNQWNSSINNEILTISSKKDVKELVSYTFITNDMITHPIEGPFFIAQSPTRPNLVAVISYSREKQIYILDLVSTVEAKLIVRVTSKNYK